MKNILTIFRKEFYRVITDKRLIFTSIILPGLAIYIMYSFLGGVVQREVEDVKSHNMIVYVENMPTDFQTSLTTMFDEPEFTIIDDMTQDDLEDKLRSGDADLIMRFPSDFETTIDAYDTTTDPIPNLVMYYNPSEDYSREAYYNVGGALELYASSIGIERFGDAYNPFSINIDFTDNEQHVYDEERATGQLFAGMLPMLIIMFLFSGAMSIGPDSIAGEKERGTIATLLVTPVKRSEIAIGKVLSLSVISMFSAASSFIGIVLSLPKLMQASDLSITIYGVREFVMLFTVLLATVLFIVATISVISAYAKSIKEASLLIMPFYFASIVVGMSKMMSGEAETNPLMYMIPIYNSVNIIISILTFESSMASFFIMIGSSLVLVSILIFVLNKFFQSEKIMFSK